MFYSGSGGFVWNEMVHIVFVFGVWWLILLHRESLGGELCKKLKVHFSILFIV